VTFIITIIIGTNVLLLLNNLPTGGNLIPIVISSLITVFAFTFGVVQALRSRDLEGEKKQLQEEIAEVRTSQNQVEYYWETYREAMSEMLFTRGIIDPSLFTDVPMNYIDELMKRYVQEHLDIDLEYQEKLHVLRLRTASSVQHIEDLLKPIADSVRDGLFANNVQNFEDMLEEVLQSVSASVSFGEVSRQRNKYFATFLLDTGTVFENLRVPNPLTLLASPDYEVSDETIEQLRHFLVDSRSGIETQIAILLLFCERQKFSLAKQRIATILGDVYARDVVVAYYVDLSVIVSSKEPEKIFRRFVLEHVNLAAVAPYIITGPTPVHFFFGREHELREISDHLATTSYIILGGRRIGKTSIVRRLHAVRLPQAGFRTLYYDCSTISSYDAFLATSIRDWQPDLPTNAPTTFGELFQNPPNDKALVLLLDEADKLVPFDRKTGWQIFNTLRAFVNSKHAQVILSGERTLRDALKDTNGPLFNFANEMLLGPLNYADVKEIVTRPMNQLEIKIVDEAAITKQIYDFTSGHPNIVQRLCRRLIDRLNERGDRYITLEDVMAVIKDPQFQEVDFLQTYWEAATPLEKIITLVISQNVGVYSMREVRQLLSEQVHIQPGAEETKDALDRLVDLRSLLKRTSAGYTFAVEAFSRVVVSTTTVEDLLEVLVEQYKNEERQA
jgi:AAA+ ATPase superfamily predicted ATPase